MGTGCANAVNIDTPRVLFDYLSSPLEPVSSAPCPATAGTAGRKRPLPYSADG